MKVSKSDPPFIDIYENFPYSSIMIKKEWLESHLWSDGFKMGIIGLCLGILSQFISLAFHPVGAVKVFSFKGQKQWPENMMS